MIISANWISDYVDHGLTMDELADHLTMGGLEVEGIERIGSTLDGLLVGHVLGVMQHPNADRLTLCEVNIGENNPVSIVCGAPNVAAGQNVAVATVGSTLSVPSKDNSDERVTIQIKKSKIRGVESFGMICAEDELGLSDDHAGILVLSDDAVVGQPLADYFSAREMSLLDHAIDIAITPNRPDAVCHVGVARDIVALTGSELRMPEILVPDEGGSAAEAFSVRIEASDACHRYVGILVRDVNIGESPFWLRQRLKAIGLRPRNNIVDITNYVMYELGQPLHAFDFDQLAGPEIIVHKTSGKSTFVTLDGKERDLPDGTLMIADAEHDVAIAGVMGGENSEVTDQTRHVLIESAYFEPSGIRRTAKSLQLQTDASYRFERGIDPELQARAAARAAALMVDLAGGTLVDGMVDSHPVKTRIRTISLRPDRVDKVLGVHMDRETMIRQLTDIGFRVEPGDGEESLVCIIPTFRPDIEREIDVIEEVARLYGFDKIPEPTRSIVPNHPIRMAPDRALREQVRDLLSGIGLREVYTNSMLKRETAESFNDSILPGARFGGEVVETLNPISRDMSTLRPSLLPGVLAVVGHNQNRGQKAIGFFEFGHVHIRKQTEFTIVENYTERECLLVVQSGNGSSSGWDTDARECDIFDLKGVTEHILESVHLPDVRFVPIYTETALTVHHLDIISGSEPVGSLGRLTAEIEEQFEIRAPLYYLEVDWSTVSTLAAPHMRRRYVPFSRHPIVERDIAVIVDRSVTVGPMIDLIRRAGGALLSSVDVFDLFEGDRIGKNCKSVAFALSFSADRTLRDKEVDRSVGSIIDSLEKEFGAKLRQ